MKRHLFFLRAYNDVDNIAPVIYFLLKRSAESVVHVVFYWDIYDYRDNENLAFLAEQFPGRLQVEWLGERLGHDADRGLQPDRRRTLWRRFSRRFKPPELRTVTKASGRFPQEKRNAIVGDILGDGPRPGAVYFDQNRSKWIGGLVQALREHGVRTVVSLPVSPRSNFNTFRSKKMLSADYESLRPYNDYDVFDKVVHTDRFYVENLEKTYALLGHPSPLAGKVEVLGSIRYCPEWMKIRQRLVAPYQRTSDKVKLVFFLSRPETNAFWDEVLRSIEFIAQFSNLEIVIKPHTRHFTFQTERPGEHVTVESETPSSALIDWADAVMVWGSSIALEAFVKGKKVLVLDYVNGNRNLYEFLNAGWILRCRDDLHRAMVTLGRDGPAGVPYDDDAVERLIQEVVYGGRSDSVPDRYLEFLDACEASTASGAHA